jgi:hypothetical protein
MSALRKERFAQELNLSFTQTNQLYHGGQKDG